MVESFRKQFVLYLLAAAALALVVARACLQSMTIDEANSILIYVNAPAGTHWYPASGNHVLDSALARLFSALFGINEFSTRAPAILGAIIYIWSAVRFAMLITARQFLRWMLFAFLVFNPLVLDYLIAGRGYSLAVACLFAALYRMAKIVLSGGESDRFRTDARWASFFIAISFCSNFSFAYADTVTILAVFLWAAMGPPRRKLGYWRLAECCFLPGIITAVAICGPTVWEFPRSQLYFGSMSLRELWHSVISATFDELNPNILNSWMLQAFHKIRSKLPIAGIVTLAGMLIAMEWQRWRSRKSGAEPFVTLARLLIAIAAFSFLAHWIAFKALKIPLPEGRTALMFVLLWSMTFAVAIAARFQIPHFDVAGMCAAVVLVASVAYFAGCLRLGYFKEWQFDADTKELYWRVADLRTRCGITKFGIDWRYSSALDFYRLAYHNVSIPNLATEDSGNLPTDRDAYAIFYPSSEDFIKQQHLELTYTNPETGAVIGIRGCPAAR